MYCSNGSCMLAAVPTALAKDVCGDHLLFNDSELASSFPRMLKLSSKFAAKNVLMDRKKCFILEHSQCKICVVANSKLTAKVEKEALIQIPMQLLNFSVFFFSRQKQVHSFHKKRHLTIFLALLALNTNDDWKVTFWKEALTAHCAAWGGGKSEFSKSSWRLWQLVHNFSTFSQDFISIGGCDLCTLKSEADKAIPFFFFNFTDDCVVYLSLSLKHSGFLAELNCTHFSVVIYGCF